MMATPPKAPKPFQLTSIVATGLLFAALLGALWWLAPSGPEAGIEPLSYHPYATEDQRPTTEAPRKA